MKTRDRLHLTVVLWILPVVILALLIDLFFPAVLQDILKLSFLFFIYLLFFIFFRKNQIIPFIKPIPSFIEKSLSFLPWVGSIMLIQLVAICLFLGQLFTINQYEAVSHHLPDVYAMQSFLDHLRLFCHKQWLFPWSIVCAIMLLIFQLMKKPLYSPSLTGVFKANSIFFGRVPEFPLVINIRLLVAFSIGFASLQLGLILYPPFSVFFTPLLGLATCFLLILFTQAKAFQSVLKQLGKKHYPPIIFCLIFLFFITVVCIGFGIIAKFAFAHNAQKLVLFHSLHFYSESLYPTLYGIFIFAWWILAMPTLGSLILFISHGRKIKHTIAVCFILPILLFIISGFFQPPTLAEAASFPIQLVYTIQFIAYAGLCLLFKNKSSHLILWFGHYPIKTLVKLRSFRVVEYQSLCGITLGLLLIFSLSGIQGLQFLFSFAAFFAIVLYFLLLFKSWRK